MLSHSRRFVPAVVLLAAAMSAGPAAAQDLQDLRSPDARTPVEQVSSSTWQDLRSPDARTPIEVAAPKAVKVDLRTPDAVDGPAGDRSYVAVEPGIVRVSVPAVDNGFEWADAGIGAGIIFALLVLPAGGYALMVAHRRSAGGAPLAH